MHLCGVAVVSMLSSCAHIFVFRFLSFTKVRDDVP